MFYEEDWDIKINCKLKIATFSSAAAITTLELMLQHRCLFVPIARYALTFTSNCPSNNDGLVVLEQLP